VKYGCQSEIGPIKSILLKHPKDAFYDQKYVNENWKDLNYTGCPDYETVVKEFDTFAAVLKKEVSDIHFLPKNSRTGMDSIYTHDPALITENGAILCNMGKNQRREEPSAMGQYLTELDIPILGSISGSGKLEGGDVVWLDKQTLAVGLTYRTNAEGIRQLKELTEDIVKDIIPVPLPHWNGENDCFHLMSIISPVDNDLAVVYSRLMPVFFREMLVSRGMRLIEVPDSEYGAMGCNVLAIAPRKCIVVSGNPLTKKTDKHPYKFKFSLHRIPPFSYLNSSYWTRHFIYKC